MTIENHRNKEIERRLFSIPQDRKASKMKNQQSVLVNFVNALKKWAIRKNSSEDVKDHETLSAKEDLLQVPDSYQEDLNIREPHNSIFTTPEKEHLIIGNTVIFVNMNSEEINNIMLTTKVVINDLIFVFCELENLILTNFNLGELKILHIYHCWNCNTFLSQINKFTNQVSQVNLSRNRLCYIPSALERFTNLEKLNFSYNEVSNDEKLVLSKMSNLEQLNMSFNLYQTIPKLHVNLKRINMSRCLVTSMKNVLNNDHPNLEKVDLSYNRIKEEYKSCKIGSSLTNLIVSHNKISSTSRIEIYDDNKLQHIDIGSNKLKDLQCFADLVLNQLNSLILSHNKLESVPASIFSRCPRLRCLDLFNNKITSLPLGVTIQTSIKTLILGSNKITKISNSFITENNNIELLDVHKNPLVKVPMCFYNLKMLKSLDLSHIRLHNLDNEFCTVLKNLETLRMTGNYLVLLPKNFKLLRNLKELQLGFNSLTDVDNLFTGESSLLEILNLNGNKIMSLHPSFKGLNQTLKSLIVYNNPLIKSFCRGRICEPDLKRIFNVSLWL